MVTPSTQTTPIKVWMTTMETKMHRVSQKSTNPTEDEGKEEVLGDDEEINDNQVFYFFPSTYYNCTFIFHYNIQRLLKIYNLNV